MEPKLGKFEGRIVQAAVLKLSGTKMQGRVGKLAKDETVFFVGRAQVSKISHEEVTAGGGATLYSRVQTAGVAELVIIEESDGKRMIEEGIMLANELFGVRDLFHPDNQGNVEEEPPDGD